MAEDRPEAPISVYLDPKDPDADVHDLPSHGDVTVRVFDEDADPIMHARVNLRLKDGSVQLGQSTDANGRTTFSRVPIGTWTLTVKHGGYHTHESLIKPHDWNGIDRDDYEDGDFDGDYDPPIDIPDEPEPPDVPDRDGILDRVRNRVPRRVRDYLPF